MERGHFLEIGLFKHLYSIYGMWALLRNRFIQAPVFHIWNVGTYL